MDIEPKELIASRLDTEMDTLAGSTWTPRQKFALAARILGSEGHWRGLAGQITCRANEPCDILDSWVRRWLRRSVREHTLVDR